MCFGQLLHKYLHDNAMYTCKYLSKALDLNMWIIQTCSGALWTPTSRMAGVQCDPRDCRNFLKREKYATKSQKYFFQNHRNMRFIIREIHMKISEKYISQDLGNAGLSGRWFLSGEYPLWEMILWCYCLSLFPHVCYVFPCCRVSSLFSKLCLTNVFINV